MIFEKENLDFLTFPGCFPRFELYVCLKSVRWIQIKYFNQGPTLLSLLDKHKIIMSAIFQVPVRLKMYQAVWRWSLIVQTRTYKNTSSIDNTPLSENSNKLWRIQTIIHRSIFKWFSSFKRYNILYWIDYAYIFQICSPFFLNDLQRSPIFSYFSSPRRECNTLFVF